MAMKGFSGKLALAAATGPAAFAAGTSNAALVTVSTPLSISFTDLPEPTLYNRPELDSVPWDVDGDGNTDFVLQARRSMFFSGSGLVQGNFNSNQISKRRWFLNPGGYLSASTLNGLGILFPSSSGGAPFSGSATPSIGANPLYSGVLFSYSRQQTSINPPNSNYSYLSGAGLAFGYSAGDNNIAFAFGSGGNTHYGWAIVNLTDAPGFRPTIKQWTYETEPDTPVHVGAVPVPAMLAPSLALLAFGAAGVRRWREGKAHRQEQTAA